MENLISKQAVTLNAEGKRVCRGEIQIEHVSFSTRLIKAVLKALGGLLITAVMVLIPLLHFILVPLGLIITVILFMSSFNSITVVSGGNGTCPFCNKPISFARRSLAFPFFETCESCTRESKILPE